MAGTRLFIIGVTTAEIIVLLGCSLYWTIRSQAQECLEIDGSRRGHHYVEYCKKHPSAVLWNKASSFLFPVEGTMDDRNIMLSSSSSSMSSKEAVHVEFTLWHQVDNYVGSNVNHHAAENMKKNHKRMSALMKDSFLNPLIHSFMIDDPHNYMSFGVSSQMGCCLLPEQHRHTTNEELISVPLTSLSKSHFLLDEVNGDFDTNLFHDIDNIPIQKLISVVIHVSPKSFAFQQKDSIDEEDHSSIAQYKDTGFLCLVKDNALSMRQTQSSLYRILHKQLQHSNHPNHDDFYYQESFERSFIEDYAIGYYFPLIFPLIMPTFITLIREMKRYKQKVKVSSTEKST